MRVTYATKPTYPNAWSEVPPFMRERCSDNSLKPKVSKDLGEMTAMKEPESLSKQVSHRKHTETTLLPFE